MKNLKFRTRLIIGFSIIILFSFLIGVLAILEIQNIEENTELIYRHPLTVSNAVRDINVSFNTIQWLMKDISIAENEDEMNSAIQQINYYDSLINVSFAIVRERFLGDKNIIEDTYIAYKNWESIKNEIIQLKKDGKNKEAATLTKKKGAKDIAFLLEKTKRLTDFAKGKGDEFYQKARAGEKKSIIILLGVISALLILSLTTAIIISNSISAPIRKFVHTVNRIHKKEVTTDESLFVKNEQELLIHTALELKTSYEKLENFNRELDEKVATRTLELSEIQEKLLDQVEEYYALNEEYKAQNEELAIAKERAEESERLKSSFLANMSHEIRTPMNSIIGFAELLRMENLTPDKKKKYLDLIRSGGKRLLTLISDIVDISKIDANLLSVHINSFNINELIDNLYTQFSISRNAGNVILQKSKALDDSISFIKTDETRLTQIISNLIENAQKFTKEGIIEFGYELIDKHLRFYVKDTGIGIAAEDQELIFERFRQVDNDHLSINSGTGLGLSIVKGLVNLLKGEIWIESGVNMGTTFYFTIPYVSAFKESAPETFQTENLKNNHSITVLLVEDEISNYEYLSEVLKGHNCKIIHAKNGIEAVKISQKINTIDLILMDIKIPLMNGYDATKEIRKINPDIPIIAQTAYAMAEDKIKAKEAGCNDYLAKPISRDLLLETIDKYVKK